MNIRGVNVAAFIQTSYSSNHAMWETTVSSIIVEHTLCDVGFRVCFHLRVCTVDDDALAAFLGVCECVCVFVWKGSNDIIGMFTVKARGKERGREAEGEGERGGGRERGRGREKERKRERWRSSLGK